MAIVVDSILFDIDPAAGAGSVNLRHDAFRSVRLPEWQKGQRDPRCAPAAYAISQVQPENLFLQVSLRKDDGERTAWVRAQEAADGPNLLGSIPEFRVEFLDDCSHWLTVPIPCPRLSAVGMHDDVWHWQYRIHGEDWRDAGKSYHRIYSLLDLPHAPWDVASGNSYLWPWRTVLDIACEWARGAQHSTEAAKRIGERILRLGECIDGNRTLRYDGRDTTSNFADDTFDCREFLRTLHGQSLSIHKANCSDFSSALVTFANAIGCNLSNLTLRMSDGGRFSTNPLHPIGQPAFQPPFQFRFHEVVVDGQPRPDAKVWDTCFRFGDGNPLPLPGGKGEPVLGERFGLPESGDYLARLVQPGFRSAVVAKIEALNRSVAPEMEPAEIRSGVSGIGPLPPAKEPEDKVFISGLFLRGIEFEEWDLARLSFPRLADGDTEIDSYWASKTNPDRLTLRLRIEIEDTIRDAQDRIVRRVERTPVAKFQQDREHSRSNEQPGEIVICTAIGNLAITAQNVGFGDTSLNPLHVELRSLFLQKPARYCEDVESDGLKPQFRTDVPIPLKTHDRSTWFKLFTSTGDLFAQGRNVYYRPGAGSIHAIEAFEMDGMKALRRYVYRFTLP